MRNGYPDTPGFWTYRADRPTPDVHEAIRLGVVQADTTAAQWEQLSPGMRREICRPVRISRAGQRDLFANSC